MMVFKQPAHEHPGGLASLPTELLLLIAEHVPNRDLCRMIRASQRLHTVLTDTLYLRNIHQRDSSGLPWSVRKNHVGAVCRFIRLNANVNTMVDAPPLLLAVRLNNLRLVKLLVKAGAQPALKGRDLTGTYDMITTPLGAVIHLGHTSMSRILIDAAGDLDADVLVDLTPLGVACFDNRVEIARYLLEKGAKVALPEGLVDKLLDVNNKFLKRDCHSQNRIEWQLPSLGGYRPLYCVDERDQQHSDGMQRQRLQDGPLAILRLLVSQGLEVPEEQRRKAQEHSDPRVRYLFTAGAAPEEAKKCEGEEKYLASAVEYDKVFPSLDLHESLSRRKPEAAPETLCHSVTHMTLNSMQLSGSAQFWRENIDVVSRLRLGEEHQDGVSTNTMKAARIQRASLSEDQAEDFPSLGARVEHARNDALQTWSNFRTQVDTLPEKTAVSVPSEGNTGKKKKKEKWSKFSL